MTKIEAIVREEVYQDLLDALKSVNINGITVSQVMGCGTQKGYTRVVRGSKVDINMLPKIKFEIVVSSDAFADEVIKTIRKVAFTGQPGDGKIFIYDLKDVIRIRTDEHGVDAIN
ncbi:P-II family nitrogen regulator [Pseudoramibacter sp.]|jgi:nitrogen regulatory protein P-II 1|uniref:P-II family nitrogen regulator n=1 Tax=Pseudoramibacter sp. TaxID=2034862 RepID=UPI0034593813